MKKYRFIEDPGHGWLEVPTLEVIRLGIAGKITPYSYISHCGRHCYLEEDCDLSTFARAKGWTPEDAHKNWVTVHQEFTSIRSMPSFKAERWHAVLAKQKQIGQQPLDLN